jgi:hypothetical protein
VLNYKHGWRDVLLLSCSGGMGWRVMGLLCVVNAHAFEASWPELGLVAGV